MKRLNFIFKVLLSLFLVAFSAWYDNAIYNLIALLILYLIKRLENITLFRFPRQGYFFSLLLGILFVFRAIDGYGEIWLTLPFGIAITAEGLWSATIFVTRLILIFLCFGLTIYSTPTAAANYYFQRLSSHNNRLSGMFRRWMRIALYVFYLLPASLDQRPRIKAELAASATAGSRFKNALEILKAIPEQIYRFIKSILKRSEAEFGTFMAGIEKESPSAATVQLPGIVHIAVAGICLTIHLAIITGGL